MRLTIAAAALLAALNAASHATAQEPRPEGWPAVKCARYKQSYAEAVARLTTRGLSREFLDRHEAFLASDCTGRADVCPRSEEELRLANVLVIAGMNQGMASTFMPFACRK